LLNAFYKAAQQEIDGQSAKQRIEIQIQSPNHSYQGTIPPYRGDLCDLYPVHNEQNQPALLKVVRNPTNNDLLAVEARQLKRLASVLDGAPLRAHFPSCIESFQIVDACGFRRQANVLHQE